MKEEEELEIVKYVKKRYKRIDVGDLSLISYLAANTNNFRLISEAEFYNSRRYAQIIFEYNSKRHEGLLKIEIEI